MDDLHIQTVEALPGYRLRLTLSDGRTVERDVSALVPAAGVENVFSPWRDPGYFTQVRLDSWPAPVWPNGEDLDPDVLIYDGPPPWATRRPARDEQIQESLDAIATARQLLRDVEARHERLTRERDEHDTGTP